MTNHSKFIDYNKVKKAINQSTYISFDLFDTLIKRDCYRPVELFTFVEKKVDSEFNIHSGFAELRVQAENMARSKSNAEEVTLQEIYNELSGRFSDIEKRKIMNWEEEYEYTLCQWNPFIKPLYNYCVSQKKKIFIITDIYLPEELIKRILRKLGIQYSQLFVSSTSKKMKRKGALFREVLKQTGIAPSEILHIGDNWRSDYFMPRKLGIRAVHIPKDVKLNQILDQKLYKKNSQYANLCSFINNHADTHSWNAVHRTTAFDFFSESGYEVEGPMLYGYVSWLQDQFKKDGIDKVFFLSRDGQIMQRAYRKLDKQIPNAYMYASRKALVIPSLWMSPTIRGIMESIFWSRRGTISNFFKKIGLVPDEFRDSYESAGFFMEEVYEYENLWKNPEFQRLFNDCVKQKMIAHSLEMYELLVQYLKQLDFSGKVAIVDIGWLGHMQGALEKVVKEAKIPAEIHGYYLGLRPESALLDHKKAKGYLFSRTNHENYSSLEKPFNAIVEMLFTADHGTTKCYKEENGHIRPVLGKWEYGEDSDFAADYKAIKACQEGALSFIDDILAEKDYISLSIDPLVTFANCLKLGCYPMRKDAEYFGNLHFLDDKVSGLAKPVRGWSYLIHPKELLLDFRDSQWRMGFLTRVFGEHVPYADGYDKARKLYFMFRK